MRRVKIGLIQVEQRSEEDYEVRTKKLLDAARECYLEGAELVFFPESYQHVTNREIIYRPEELRLLNAEWKERCATLSREFGAYLVPWDYEVAEDGSIYNASYILDRDGKEVGRFRKVHLTHGEEMKGISHGMDFPVFNLDFGKVGIMICFDNYFPESARILGNRGAELVLYPLYGDTLIPQWELKMRARAIDNSMYVASCQIGGDLHKAYTGLVSPNGDVLCRLESYSSHLVVEVEMGKEVKTGTTGMAGYTENLRAYLERCHRPDAYAGLLEMTPVREWEEIFHGKVPPVLTKEEYLKK
ncbi:MAG: carbon-nitrogen hydrolase family protein [Ruminococcaceae bacterium]|nr:carbon-nitrogen hydrolase family protein [Oscillospiraceae bacterium]